MLGRGFLSRRSLTDRTLLSHKRSNGRNNKALVFLRGLCFVCDILDLLQQMNIQLAAHTHVPGPTPSPTDAAAFSNKAAKAKVQLAALDAITL